MSTRTTHLQLWKPDLSDQISPEMFNLNSDILDNAFAQHMGEYDAKIVQGSYTGTGETKNFYNSTISISSSGISGTGKMYYLNNYLICITASSDAVIAYYSADNGNTWNHWSIADVSSTTAHTTSIKNLIYANGYYYLLFTWRMTGRAYANGYTRIYRSSNLSSWTSVCNYSNAEQYSSVCGIGTGLFYENGFFVVPMVSITETGSTYRKSNKILYSSDGSTWGTKATNISSSNIYLSTIATTKAGKMIFAYTTSYDSSAKYTKICYTTDGLTWTDSGFDPGITYSSADITALAIHDNKVLVHYLVASGTYNTYRSTTGTATWLLYNSGSFRFESVINGVFVYNTTNYLYMSKDLKFSDTFQLSGTYDRGIWYDGTNVCWCKDNTIYVIGELFNPDKTISLNFTPKVVIFGVEGGTPAVVAYSGGVSSDMQFTFATNQFKFYKKFNSSSTKTIDTAGETYRYTVIGS